MFRNIFRPDSALMITMTQITDCIFLSLFWLLGCFPVVTVGASFAALYDAVYRGFRKGEKNSWQTFGTSFRRNWKEAIVPTVVFLGLGAALTYCLIGLWNRAVWGEISWMLFSAGVFAGMLALGILSIMFPLLSRFENSVAGLLKNTLLLGLANLPRTLGLGILNGVSVLLCVRYVVPAFFLPALAALVGTLLIEPMLKPFMPAEEAED